MVKVRVLGDSFPAFRENALVSSLRTKMYSDTSVGRQGPYNLAPCSEAKTCMTSTP